MHQNYKTITNEFVKALVLRAERLLVRCSCEMLRDQACHACATTSIPYICHTKQEKDAHVSDPLTCNRHVVPGPIKRVLVNPFVFLHPSFATQYCRWGTNGKAHARRRAQTRISRIPEYANSNAAAKKRRRHDGQSSSKERNIPPQPKDTGDTEELASAR